MQIDWDFTAQTYLDQLPRREQAQVTRAVERLGDAWDALEPNRLSRLKSPLPESVPLYALRVGSDLRVLLKRDADMITVVDVVRRAQIDGLRELRHH